MDHALGYWAADMPHEVSAPAEEAGGGARADGHQARQERLAEYEAAALARPDPGDAVLALVKSDLIDIAFHQGKVIRQLLSDDATIDNLGRLEASMNGYLRVIRQIDRIEHLELQQVDSRRAAANAKL